MYKSLVSLLNLVGLVPSWESWVTCFRGSKLLSSGSKVCSRGSKCFSHESNIFTRGSIFFILSRDFFSWVKIFFVAQIYFSWGPSIKYVRSKGEGGGQGKSVHLLFLWRHSIVLKRTREEGCLKITKFERKYFMDGPVGRIFFLVVKIFLLCHSLPKLKILFRRNNPDCFDRLY